MVAIGNIRNAILELQRAEYELAARSFTHFVKAAIPHMGISTKITWGWYLDAICDHLEAWIEGRIRFLLINIKNKSLKSKICEVCLPAFQWAQDPSKHWFTGAGKADLATEFARECRELIQSDWYQGFLEYLEEAHNKPRWTLKGDQNAKLFYVNSAGGSRYAAWPPTGTGRQGDFFLVDDPIGITESYSDAANEVANRWVSQTVLSRFNDIKQARVAVLQHRVRRDDTSGKMREMFEESGRLCILSLPLEYDPTKDLGPTAIGWSDPRTEKGESLCPERWGPEEIEFERQTQGPKYPAVCNQDPQEDGLSVVDRAWFRTWGVDAPLPPRQQMRIVQSWDLSNKGNDPTAPKRKGAEKKRSKVGGIVVGFTENPARCYILDREFDFMNWLQQKDRLRGTHRRWPETVTTYIEDKSNGSAMVLELAEGVKGAQPPIPGIPGIVPVSPDKKGSKYLRLASVSGYIRAGCVFVPPKAQCPWVEDFLHFVCDFPGADFDEDPDILSQVLSEEWQPKKIDEKEQANKERAQLLKQMVGM